MRVLLIGNRNDVSINQMVGKYLEENYIVVIAPSSAEELSLMNVVESCSIDVVTIDCGLIDIPDVIELFKRFREINSGVCNVILASPEQLDALEQEMEDLIDEYISVPVDDRELALRIRKIARQTELNKKAAAVAPPKKAEELTLPSEPAKKEPEPKTLEAVPEPATAKKLAWAEKIPFNWRKSMDIAGKVVSGILIFMIAVLGFFLIQSKIKGGIPSVAGYQMYVALSGSMNPTFDTGSMVFVKPVKPEDIKAGDIITFRGVSANSSLTTHRVVQVNNDNGLSFTTRGDANNVNDPNPVSPEKVVGTVRGHFPYIGYLMGFAQSKKGLIFLVFIPGFLVIFYELKTILKITQEMKRNEKVQGTK